MKYRRFGKTGLRVSVVSAGFMRAMHSWNNVPEWEIPSANQDNLKAVVKRALELGINHFETARGYGTSEHQLGLALRDIPRDSFLLQTKVRPMDDPGRFRADVLDSLDRLGVERVDMLAIHGINDYRSLWQVCRRNGCLAAARELQRQGRARFVGFSGHGPPEVILEALHYGDDGGFDYLNLHWYYIDQINDPVLIEAAARDLGVFIISPTDKGGMLQRPPAKLVGLCRPLSPMQFNDLFCLSRPEIKTISVGAARPSDFDEHVAALEYIDRTADLMPSIDGRWRQAMQEATGFPRPEGLWSRLPAWERTPGYINIRLILQLMNLAQGWDLVEFGRCRYAKLGREMPWVRGNNGAAVRQFDLGEIAEQAGLSAEELVHRLEAAHALFAGEGSG